MTNTSVNAANIFQSTHPVRGATGHAPLTEMTPQISIHAPREGCDFGMGAVPQQPHISIHAPREGCDIPPWWFVAGSRISIHAPREGCDRPVSHPVRSRKVFQSTHPVRGATRCRCR